MISSVAVEQREREAKVLRSSLALYLVGSVVLHAGALVVGLNAPWNRALIPEDEPIEFVLVEPPEIEEVPEPEQKVPEPEVQTPTPQEPAETTPTPEAVEKPELTETPPEEVEETKPEPPEATKPVEEAKPASPASPAPAPTAPPVNQAPSNDQPADTTETVQAPPEGFNKLLEGTEGIPVRQAPPRQGPVGGSGNRPATATGPSNVTAGTRTRVKQVPTTPGNPSAATGSSGNRDESSSAGSGGGGRTRASINKEGSDINLDGLKQKVTAVVKDGKIVDFKFKSTGDPELDKAIRKDLAKAKKKFKLPSNAKKDGVVRANITFEDKGSKRSRRVQEYLERQARERQAPRAATQPRQRTSSVIQRGVDVAPAPRTSKPATQTSAPSATQKTAPQTSPPVRRTPVQRAPSTSTPVRRTPIRQAPVTKPVRRVPAPVAPARRSPVTSTPVRRTPAPVAPVRRAPATSTPVRRAPSVRVPVKQAPAPAAPPSTSESE